MAKAHEARVEVDAEVIGLFRDLLPDHVLGPGGELETTRQRNGCIPDLRLGFPVQLDPRPPDYHPRPGRRPAVPQPGQPDPPQPAHAQPVVQAIPQGGVERLLAELKVIGAGPSRYPRGLASSRHKATNRRARKLPAEYRSKLAHLDSTYLGTRQGDMGPCVARLETLGGILELVVGAFGEASSDLDRTIKALAESRVLFLSRESGRPVTDGWRSVVLGQYRRHFSVLFVRVQATCLTARMGHLGAEARQGAGRRRDLMALEERSRREAEAHFAAYVRGRGRRNLV